MLILRCFVMPGGRRDIRDASAGEDSYLVAAKNIKLNPLGKRAN
jgi:hypothetical protein